MQGGNVSFYSGAEPVRRWLCDLFSKLSQGAPTSKVTVKSLEFLNRLIQQILEDMIRWTSSKANILLK
ncbi:MAG: hypothetical protein ACYCSA_02740 [Thermoplasmataceae archaeon]